MLTLQIKLASPYNILWEGVYFTTIQWKIYVTDKKIVQGNIRIGRSSRTQTKKIRLLEWRVS